MGDCGLVGSLVVLQWINALIPSSTRVHANVSSSKTLHAKIISFITYYFSVKSLAVCDGWIPCSIIRISIRWVYIFRTIRTLELDLRLQAKLLKKWSIVCTLARCLYFYIHTYIHLDLTGRQTTIATACRCLHFLKPITTTLWKENKFKKQQIDKVHILALTKGVAGQCMDIIYRMAQSKH